MYLVEIHTSSVFLAGSAESLKGRGFLMSDHRPRFFRMAVLDTSLWMQSSSFVWVIIGEAATCSACRSGCQGHSLI